ncbi:MAG TPA: thioredoxin family protein [Ilumatobacteraceae bacterium]|nr:thioredoxin family protein [Ilumatobacteraceae bacterium]
MVKAIVVAVLLVAAVVVAVIGRRRQHRAAPVARQFVVPTHLDRGDFPSDTPWLVVVFTSASCHTCADVARKASVLESAAVGVIEVEYAAMGALHERYSIDAVPLLVVVDKAGTVRASFVGPVSATDLWAAVATLRDPGSTGGSGHCSSEAGADSSSSAGESTSMPP